jgi:hypothetical protein
MWTLVFAVLGALSLVLTAAAFALQEPTAD